MISVKKMPMDRTMAEFWNVALMPAPTPRWSGGRLFMMPARLGEANRPMPMPFSSRISANCQYSKLTGSSSSRTNETAATTIPPVAKGRAPNRSDSQPGGRAGDEEADGQREHVDPGPQRGALEAVAVDRQLDALQPDDQDEHQAAAAQAGQQAGQVPGGERRGS